MSIEADLVCAAERAIANILKQLEVDTGSNVECISIDSIDETTIGSAGHQLLRKVVIDLRPQPGCRWVI